MQIIISEKVPIVFTSAGNPKTWTAKLKEQGIKVVHVIANKKFALKCEEAGVDAIVAEGFEAGTAGGVEEAASRICSDDRRTGSGTEQGGFLIPAGDD